MRNLHGWPATISPFPTRHRATMLHCTDRGDRRSSGARPDSFKKEGQMTSIKTIAEKFAAWRRYREAVRELSQLSDRELDDIGIRRGDIQFVVRRALAAVNSDASGPSLRTHPPRRASPDACNARRFLPRRAFSLPSLGRAVDGAARLCDKRPCAPFTSSAAASRAARRPGRSPAPAFPSSCTKCARCAAPRRTAPSASPSSSAPIPSAPTTR